MKRTNKLRDPIVSAFDRASQDQRWLHVLVECVEEAILLEMEEIRRNCLLEGGIVEMARVLRAFLGRTDSRLLPWESTALAIILDSLDMKKLSRGIWPELVAPHGKERERERGRCLERFTPTM